MNALTSIQIHHGLAGLRALQPGSVLSIGNFDGMHRGHRRIIEEMKRLRHGTGRLAIATFEPHPLTVLRPELAPPRLTPLAEKQALLAGLGVDDLVVLPPTPDVLSLDAIEFWHLLRDHTRPTHLVEGETFTFGKARGGTIQSLRDWTQQSTVQLHVVGEVSAQLADFTHVAVNSTLIRWLIAYGRMRDAATCLGRPYVLSGVVIQGYQRGRTIGVPTANLNITDQLVPNDGVYAARCTIAGKTHPVALSIGTLPTFGPDRRRQVEAHLLDFAGDLYGQTLEVEVLDWIREQRKFDGLESLKRAIARDVEAVLEITGRQPVAARA
jgi:riboflavin kinase/FMN adenylyltransferase